MLEHIVLFRFPEGKTQALMQDIVHAALKLKVSIPSIKDLSAGINFSDRSDGYEVGLVVRFQDKAALESYLVHPSHVAFVERFIKPHTPKIIAMDYLFPSEDLKS